MTWHQASKGRASPEAILFAQMSQAVEAPSEEKTPDDQKIKPSPLPSAPSKSRTTLLTRTAESPTQLPTQSSSTQQTPAAQLPTQPAAQHTPATRARPTLELFPSPLSSSRRTDTPAPRPSSVGEGDAGQPAGDA